MTDNLPAQRADHGFAGTPLNQTPTPALAFALGYVVTQPIRAEQFGGFCALVEELRKRPAAESTKHPYRPGNAFTAIIEALPEPVARAVTTLYNMQRGQRWSHTGQPNADGSGPR